VKDVEIEDRKALKEAFAPTEEPLGWWFAGEVSEDDSRERFDFFKKSAEGGCSWGQAYYARYFEYGEQFVEKDEKVFLEWLEKAANQNNPEALYWLGSWFKDGGGDNKEKAVPYYRAAAELSWKGGMYFLSRMLEVGEGGGKDLRQAVIWSPQANDAQVIWDALDSSKRAVERGTTGDLDCDFNQLCSSIGWGLYWYQYGSEDWNHQSDEKKAFGNRCLGFYCSCVEEQQKSIFAFLWFWNRTTGVKGPGRMIAEMVWEGREDNLVKTFEQPRRRSARLKRIKK
jgi:hypothetical protein